VNSNTHNLLRLAAKPLFPIKVILRQLLSFFSDSLVWDLRYLKSKILYRKSLIIRENYIKSELGKIKKAIDRKNEILIIYDMSCTTSTYGDFLYFLILSKYFVSKKIKVTICILNDRLHYEWKNFHKDKINQMLKEYIEISSTILAEEYFQIKFFKKRDLLVNYSKKYIVFQKMAYARKSINIYLFNLIDELINQEPSKKNYLFCRSNFIPSPISDDYIGFHIRWNVNYGMDRNIKEDEFIKICIALKTRFPKYNILIISDNMGCDIAKNFANNHNLDLLYSKDYSISFLQDMAILMNSKFYTQFKGGGIGVVAYFSSLPMVTMGIFYGRHEIPYKKNKVLKIHNDDQKSFSNISLNKFVKEIINYEGQKQ